jgi:hypothetical protein
LYNPHPQIWEHWNQRLKAWDLNYFAASLLEASGPFNLAGAQLVYFGQPILNGLLPNDRLEALARLLEDPQAMADFVRELREEAT